MPAVAGGARPRAGGPTPEAATGWLIAATGLLRILVAASGHLCYGESYYFAYVLRPSLSYFDQPPLPFWLGSLSVRLLGGAGPLVLRLPFVLMFAGTTWLLFVTGRRLFGARPAFLAVLLMNVAPAFSLRAGFWLGPDGPLAFFWVACTWCLVQLFFAEPARHPLRWWAGAGLMLGLGLLSKYSMALLVPGVALYVLRRPDLRGWLARPGPYVALAVALAAFTPVLAWNAAHGWISLLWQGHRGVEFRGLHLDWLLWNIGGQSIEFLPWLWIVLVAELVRILATWRRAGEARRFVGCLAPLPVLLFTAVSAYAPIGNHFYWGAPGYLLLFLPLGETVHRALERGSLVARRWLYATVALAVVAMTIAITHTATGWLAAVPAPLARPFAGLPDPTLECVDWTELPGALAQRGLLGRRDVFLFTDRWYRSGKVEYALRGAMPVLAFHPTDQRGWAFIAPSDNWVGKEGIMVTERAELARVAGYYGPYCSRLDALGPVVISRGGRPAVTLYLYRCERLVLPYPRPYG